MKDFDLINCRLSPEQTAVLLKAYTKARAKVAGRAKRRGGSKRRAHPYVQVTIDDAVAASHSLSCPQMLVWIHLHYRAWKTGSATVSLGNKVLIEMGVSRLMKSRALQRLEEGGLIKVKRRNGCNPTVTIVGWTPPNAN